MSENLNCCVNLPQQKTETAHVNELVKSVYAFEFLGLKARDAVEESDLETAMLDHLHSDFTIRGSLTSELQVSDY